MTNKPLGSQYIISGGKAYRAVYPTKGGGYVDYQGKPVAGKPTNLKEGGYFDIRGPGQQPGASPTTPAYGPSGQPAPAQRQKIETGQWKGGYSTGLSGEALPQGAVAFNEQGEPVYGNGLGGYFKGVEARMSRPIEGMEGGTEQLKNFVSLEGIPQYTEEWRAANRQNLSAFIGLLGPGVHNLENLPVGLGYLGRATTEVVRGALALFGEITMKAEQVVGTGYGLTKGETLPEAWQASRIAWTELYVDVLKPAALWAENRGAVRPTGEIKSWDEAVLSARSTYTHAVLQSSVREEFLRRYRAGDNPYLIASELADPWAEMVGQIVVDPLWIVGWVSKGASVAGKAMHMADEASDAAKGANLVNDALNIADPVAQAAKVAEGLPAVRAAAAAEKAELVASGLKTGLNVVVSSGKASAMSDSAHIVATGLLGAVKKVEDLPQYIWAWAKVATGAANDQELALAIQFLKKDGPGLYRLLSSKQGIRTGQMAADMFLDSAGHIDNSRLKALEALLAEATALPKAQSALGQQKIVEYFMGKLDDASDAMFPSVVRRLEIQKEIAELQGASKAIPRNLQRFVGDKIGTATRHVAQMDAWLRGQKGTGPVALINKFFATIYMGMSPGYAFRNLATNSFHMLVDYGPKVFVGPKQALADLEAWGAINRQAMVGFGKAAGPAAGAETSQRGFFNYFLAKSGEFEQNAAVQVSRHAFLDSMRKLWKRGAALPQADDLMRAGMSGDDIKRLEQLAWAAHGDSKKAIQMFFGEGGMRRTLLHLTEEQLGALDSIPGARQAIEDAIRAADNPEDAIRGIEQARAELRRAIRQGKTQEHIPEEGSDAAEALVEINRADGISDVAAGAPQNAAQDLLGRKIGVQQAARDSMRGAVQRLQTLVVQKLGMTPEGDAVRGIFNKANAEAGKIMNTARAEKEAALRQILSAGPSERNWDEWMKVGGIRDSIWNRAEDAINARMEKAIEDIVTVPGGAGADMQEIERARAAYQESMLWRQADEELFRQTRQVYIKPQDARGWAIKLGDIPTATAEGAKIPGSDAHILNAINANLPEGMAPFKNLDDVPPDVAEAAFRLRAAEDIPSAREASVIADAAREVSTDAVKSSDVWRPITGAPKGYTRVYRRTDNALKEPGLWASRNPFDVRQGRVDWADIPDDIAGTAHDAANIENIRRGHPPSEEFHAVYLEGVDVTWNPPDVHPRGGIPGSPEASAFREAKIASAKNAKVAQGIGPEAEAAADTIAAQAENVQGPARLGPIGENGMNPVRAIAEQEAGYESLFDKISTSTRENWGRIAAVPGARTPAQEAALMQWAKTLGDNMITAKATSMSVADAARRFTLLDYSQKKGWNMALNYLMPYHYWYNGTYRNWMTRLVENPGVVGAYAAYRHGLEQAHAGMPDQWKYSLNSNELLGINSENPIYLNLEATLNPLNGLTGVDFNDPDRKRSWMASVLDGLGKFGPSVWTPLMLGTAGAMWMGGDKEGAAAVAGRLIPQTATIKAVTGILGVNQGAGVEFDPLVQLMQGGIDKYERNRIGRALGEMVQNGEITREQAVDAARLQSGQAWERAAGLSMEKRQWGQLASFALGVGFKARNATDIQIDQMYSEMFALTSRKADLSPEEYRSMWNSIEQRYPFMDTVLLSRKGTAERDEALAWSVLGRIPPGQSNDYATLAGISGGLIDKFYTDKGNFSGWPEADRLQLLGGVVALGALLAIPDGTTKNEWDAARSAYSKMLGQISEETQRKIDVYYSLKDDRQRADAFLRAHPEVEQALDFKAQSVMNSPVLSKFYGGIEFVEGFYKSQMYKEAEQTFGADIQKTNENYWDIRDKDGNYKAYLRDHPELKKYWDFLDAHKQRIAQQLLSLQGRLPDKPRPFMRADADRASVVAQDIIAGMADVGVVTDPEIAAYMTDKKAETIRTPGSLQAWLGSLPPYYQRLIDDWVQHGDPLPAVVAQQMRAWGITADMLK